MKKTAKILSILLVLAVCLSCVTMFVAALGAKGDGTVSILPKFNSDFESKAINTRYAYKGQGTATHGLPTNAGGTGFTGAFAVEGYYDSEGTLKNKYFHWYHENHQSGIYNATSNPNGTIGTTTNNPYIEFAMGGIVGGSDLAGDSYGGSFTKYDYFTVDFDVSTGAYLDANNNLTTDVKEAALSSAGTPIMAYNDGFSFQNFWRYKSSAGSATSNNYRVDKAANALVIRNIDGKSYLTFAENESIRYELPSVINEWTHVTFVFKNDSTVNYKDGTTGPYDKARNSEIASTNFANSKLHIYINGVYFATTAAIPSGAVVNDIKHFTIGDTITINSVGPDVIRMWPNVSKRTTTDSSVLLDNAVTNFYPKGYDGSLSKVEDFTKLNVTELPDVTFTSSYVMPYPNLPEAILTRGETNTSYVSAVGALNIATESDTVTLNKSVFDYYPKNDLYIVLGNENVQFTVAGDSGYSTSRVDNTIVVSEAGEDEKCTIMWDPDEILGETMTSTGVLDAPFTYPSDVDPKPIYVSDGVYKTLSGWAWYGPDDEYEDDPIISDVLTEEMIEYAIDDAGYIELHPVFEEVTYKYTITEADGKTLIDYKGSYDCYSNTSAFLGTLNDIALNNSDIVIKLYSDIEYSGSVNFVEDGKYAIDLNGYTLKSPSQIMFQCKDGNNISLYSSKEGGMILANRYVFNYGNAGYHTPLTFNIGKVGDADGDNLTVYCSIFLELIGAQKKNGADTSAGKNTIVNIEGGQYYRAENQTYALLCLRINSIFRAKDALFAGTYAGKAYGQTIITDDYRYYSSVDAIFENCDIYAGKQNTNIVNNLSDYDFTYPDGVSFSHHSRIEFSGCNIWAGGFKAGLGDKYDYGGKTYQGKDQPETVGAPIFTNGTRFYDTATTSNITVPEGYAVVVNPNATENTITLVYPYDCTAASYNGEWTTEVITSTLKYYVAEKTEATVNWYDGEGNLLKTETAAVGAYAQNDGSAVPFVDLGNGIYNLGFRKWVDKDGNDADLFIAEAGATYNFYADCSGVVLAKNIAGVKVNLDLYTHYELGVYFPTSTLPENVKVLGAYDSQTEAGKIASYRLSYPTIDGVEYFRSCCWPVAAGLMDMKTVHYLLEINHEGETFQLYYTIKLSALDYCRYVLESDKFEDDSNEKVLIANLLRYANLCYKVSKGSDAEGIVNLMNEYSDLLIDTSTLQFNELQSTVDYSGLVGVVSEVSFNIGLSQPGFFVKGADIKSVQFSYKGIAGNMINNTATATAGGYASAAISIYNITLPLNVKITMNDGTVKTGTYSLAEYIRATEAAGGDASAARILAAYSLASYNYKTGK